MTMISPRATPEYLETGYNTRYSIDGEVSFQPHRFRTTMASIDELCDWAGVDLLDGDVLSDSSGHPYVGRDVVSLNDVNEFFVLEGGPATSV